SLRVGRRADHQAARLRLLRDPHDRVRDAGLGGERVAVRRRRLPPQAGPRGRAARLGGPGAGGEGTLAAAGRGAAPEHRHLHPRPAQEALADVEAAGEADRAVGVAALADRAGGEQRQRDLAVQDRARSQDPPAGAVRARLRFPMIRGLHGLFFSSEPEAMRAFLRDKVRLPRGVLLKGPVPDHSYGLVTYFRMPGGVDVQLYEPKYKRGSRPASAAARNEVWNLRSGRSWRRMRDVFAASCGRFGMRLVQFS